VLGLGNGNNDIGFFLLEQESVVPKGMQMNRDRLGNVMYSATTVYYPYGEEYAVTANDRDKFGTYHRDSTTGLDYAVNRYYSTQSGRFLTADPYRASGGPAEPGSWNRYALVADDPINYSDRVGLARAPIRIETPPVTVTATFTGVPIDDIVGSRRDPSRHWEEAGTFIPLSLERELRCEQAAQPELSPDQLETFLGGVEMDAEERAELYGTDDDSKKGTEKDVLPAFVVATATAAQWGVYWARTPTGQYYIGVTSNFAARQAAHALRGLQIVQIRGIPLMNYAAAKGVEQNLIESFRRNGVQLLNRINSISSSNRFYQQFTGMGSQVLRGCRAQLPPGFPWP
jgi:RHS repeat-associated protein